MWEHEGESKQERGGGSERKGVLGFSDCCLLFAMLGGGRTGEKGGCTRKEKGGAMGEFLGWRRAL